MLLSCSCNCFVLDFGIDFTQSVGRGFGDSETDPFRHSVVLLQVSVHPHRGKNQAKFNGKTGRDD